MSAGAMIPNLDIYRSANVIIKQHDLGADLDQLLS